MIGQTEAERIARAVNAIRPDWPITSIVTLIQRELTDWPWLDLLVGLMYVAGERNLDGSWTSRTPARVKEQGPWHTIGIADANTAAATERATREAAERREQIRVRNQQIRTCTHCDTDGRLPGDIICPHDNPDQRATRAAERAARVRANLRPTINTTPPEQAS